MRIVLDTNILISATIWDKSVSNKLLRILAGRDIEILTSYDILEEYKKVLRRDFKYEHENINKIILELLSYIQVIEPQRKVEVVKEDPDDNKIIECAVESGSDYILTYDKHLLTLEEFEGIKIIKPEEFLGKFDWFSFLLMFSEQLRLCLSIIIIINNLCQNKLWKETPHQDFMQQ